MNSPILEYLAFYGIDPAYIIIGLLAVVFIFLNLIILNLFKNIKNLIKQGSHRTFNRNINITIN